jgi:drug/metabolite transporter (DMT)-like permease
MRLLALTAVVMLAFAANSVLNRMAVGTGAIDAAAFAAIRLASGAAVLAVLVLLRGKPLVRDASVAGVAGLLCYLFGFSVAYGQLDAGTGALLLFGTVQIVMFAGALAGGERVPPRRIAGAVLALGGLAVLLAPQGAGGIAAYLAMVVAGIGWGIYSLAGRRAADALAATTGNFVLALPVGLLGAVVMGANPQGAAASGIALAVLSGAVTSGMGYALWYRILPDLGASRAAVAQLTVPLLAAAGGAVLMAEGVGLSFALAALLVLGGVALASR